MQHSLDHLPLSSTLSVREKLNIFYSLCQNLTWKRVFGKVYCKEYPLNPFWSNEIWIINSFKLCLNLKLWFRQYFWGVLGVICWKKWNYTLVKKLQCCLVILWIVFVQKFSPLPCRDTYKLFFESCCIILDNSLFFRWSYELRSDHPSVFLSFCPLVIPSFRLSVRKFSWYWLISFFWNSAWCYRFMCCCAWQSRI